MTLAQVIFTWRDGTFTLDTGISLILGAFAGIGLVRLGAGIWRSGK